MQWKTFTISTTTDAEDFVCGMLLELGIDSVEILDHRQITEEERQAMFIDILPELPDDDGTASVRFYLDEETDERELLEQIRARMREMSEYVSVGEGRITRTDTKDQDWLYNWKQYFKPFAVDDLLIRPTWEQAEDEANYPMVIQIDPGTAFGTGLHETTQLCIRQLRRHVKPADSLFDVGCGSGILGILALKLGAGRVVCMDIDPEAVRSAEENFTVNGLNGAEYDIFCGDLLADDPTAAVQRAGVHCHDVVVSNILAEVICRLAGVVGAHLKERGLWVTSGILYTKEQDVRAAMTENGFEILEVARQNDWVAITAARMSEGQPESKQLGAV